MARFQSKRNRISPAAILMLLMGMIIGLRAEASDSGTFFLKATKNVPRIGRRSGDGDNTFFLKAPKNVPRIGRRGENNGNPWGYFDGRDVPASWASSRQEVIPSRAVRVGPSSLANMWNSPLHYNAPAKVRTPLSSVESSGGVEGGEEQGRLDNSGPRYQLLDSQEEDESSQEIEFSSYQMVAPPPFQQQLQRLPQEGGFDPYRQQRNRDGQPEK